MGGIVGGRSGRGGPLTAESHPWKRSSWEGECAPDNQAFLAYKFAAGESLVDLQFQPNGSAHDDVIVRVARNEFTCDSYYFLICGERDCTPEDSQESIVRSILGLMLDEWVEAVEQLQVGQSTHLPFDFSDQCSRWIHVVRTDASHCVVRHMSDPLEAWAMSPVGFRRFLGDLRDPNYSSERYSIDRQHLLAELRFIREREAEAGK